MNRTEQPRIDEVLEHPAPALNEDDAARVLLDHFGIRGRLGPLDSERDQNFLIETTADGAFVLKISNAAEDPTVPAMQNAALEHIAAVAPGLPVPRVHPAENGQRLLRITHRGNRHCARLIDFLPGVALDAQPRRATPLTAIASVLAELGRALRGFFHPAAGRDLLWDLKHTARLGAILACVDDKNRRNLAAASLGAFENRVQPQLAGLRAQVIHGDLNPANILVDPANPGTISGIIDFGDIVHTPLICDLAVAVAYQLFEADQPARVMAQMCAAYHAKAPLSDEELELLPALVAARLTMTGVIAYWRVRQHPANREYILGHQALAWDALARLSELDETDLRRHLREACTNASDAAAPVAHETDADLAKRRERVLGPSLRLFYDRPLRLERGDGVFVYDDRGRRYLDAYNNVVSVGHANPDVVAAINRQARRLNTHTRYLHPAIVDYAERLVALLPPSLEVCTFVCSGSEANDLALQMARWVTGNTGAVVTEHAYHGTTAVVRELSTEDVPPAQRPDWIATTAAPNPFSGKFRGRGADTVSAYVADFSEAVAVLDGRGRGLAATFVDSLYSSEGVLVPAPGYLAGIAKRCRAAGGLFVADEVQAGFGRSGTHFWGFSAHDIVPDIVTLGKPIGNGHPLAAVVTTRAIAEEFGRRGSYFNTCAGNPVSCAAGMAVLDVIERDGLQARSRDVGNYLKGRLRRLLATHPTIGDIRGSGLFIGIELVSDPETLAPATETARRVVNRLRQRGVLIGRTGPGGNVLKIRPPLVFGRDEADLLVERLVLCLEDEAD